MLQYFTGYDYLDNNIVSSIGPYPNLNFLSINHRGNPKYREMRQSAGMEINTFPEMLCFDLLTRPKMPFKVMHRKEVTHSNGSYERKSRGRKLTDEMGRAKKNFHGTLQSDAPEENDLWTAWQLFPLDDD